jgi:hypothetical protein
MSLSSCPLFGSEKFYDKLWLTMVNLDDYPIPAPDFVWRLLEREAVLVLPDAGKVKVLNEIGARIWALADGSRTVDEIARQLCTEFVVEISQAQADTQAFIDQLVQRQMLTLSKVPHET